MEIFSPCPTNFYCLSGGGIALALYLPKKNDKEEKWSNFVKEISSGDQLKDLSLSGLTDENKWSEVKQRIEKHLLAKFKDIFNNETDLNILLKDGDKVLDLTGSIPKIYFEKSKKFKIVLSHKQIKNSDKVFDQELKIEKSLSTFWSDFIKEVSSGNQLKDLSLNNFTNKNNWDDVLKAITEKLDIKFEKVFGNKTDLMIELNDENNQKLVSSQRVDKDYDLISRKIRVKLSHKKLSNEKAKTFDFVFDILFDLSELEQNPIKELLKVYKNNSPDEFKKNFLAKLNTIEKYQKYKFVEEDFEFVFDLAKEGGNEVKVRVAITPKNNNKVKGSVVVSGGNYNELKLDLNKLLEAINSKINTIKPIGPKPFNNIIKELLKEEAYQKYNINLEDELIIHFIPPKNNKLGSFSIEAKDDSLNAKGKTNGEIAVYDSLLFDLNQLQTIVGKLLKDFKNNNENEFKKNFIDELNKVQDYQKYKFVEEDFNFDFDLAKKGYNEVKVRVTITAKNHNKVKGEVKGSGGDYAELKLNLNDLVKDINKQITKNEPNSTPEFKNLIKDLLKEEAYKNYNINLENELIIDFIAPKINQLGNFSIKANDKSLNVRDEIKQIIDVYDTLLFDLKELELIIENLLKDYKNNTPKEFEKNFVIELNKIGNYQKYNFVKEDFKFVFAPAGKGFNEFKVRVTITPNNKNKVKGEVKGRGGNYAELKLDLKDLLEKINPWIKANKPNTEQDFISAIKLFLDTIYKQYNIDLVNDLFIKFKKPENNKPGSFSIEANDKSLNAKGEVLEEKIGVYDSLLFDLSELEPIIKELLKDYKNNSPDEFKKNFLTELNKIEKYKKYKFVEEDFNFVLIPAKIGENKIGVRVSILPRNKNKVTGSVVVNGGNYAELKLDLNKLLEAINSKITKNKPLTPEAFNNIIKELLKEEAYKNYNINLEDELIIDFKPPENNKLGSFSIETKDDSLNAKGKTNGEIAVYDSLLFDLSKLENIVKKLLKEYKNNSENEFKKNFIDELNKVQDYQKYKFVEEDFNFDFDLAKKGYNEVKVRVTITAKNHNKVKGEVKGSGGDYAELKLNLNDLVKDINKQITKNEPNSTPEFKNLIKDLLKEEAYKNYNINLENELIIDFIAPKINQLGNFSIKANDKSLNVRDEIKQIIDVYDTLLFDLKELELIIENLLKDYKNNTPKEFEKNFVIELNKIGNYQKYNFVKEDFKFVFAPAGKGFNEFKVRVTITPNNKNKVKGEVKGRGGNYAELKLDLKDLLEKINPWIKANKPNTEQDFISAIKLFLDTIYKQYNIDLVNDLFIKFKKPENNKPGSFSIEANDKSLNAKGEVLEEKIGVYDSLLFDLSELEPIIKELLKDYKNNSPDEFKKNFLTELNKIEKYKKYKFVEEDFNFVLIPAKIGENKIGVRVSILPRNKNKVTGSVVVNGGNYAELKLDLNKLLEAINSKITKNKPLTPEAFNNIIKELLKEEAYKNYNINLEDELIIDFKPPENNKLGSFSIETKDDSLNAKGKTNGEIAVYDSLLFDLSKLENIVKKLLKEYKNNSENEFKKNFIDELNKVQDYQKFKFVGEDFKFNFDLAKIGDNEVKVRVTITAKNHNKVKGEVKGSGGDYAELKLNFNDLKQDIKNLIKNNQLDNLEEIKKYLQKYFDNKHKDYAINVSSDLELECKIPEFNINESGFLNLKPSNSGSTKLRENLEIKIPYDYYQKYQIDFVKFEKTLYDKIKNNQPNDLDSLKKIINNILNTNSLNKYNNKNIISLDDLDIKFVLDKPKINSTKLEISIYLKTNKQFKAKNGISFDIKLTPTIVSLWNKFYNQLNNVNNLDSLKKRLEEKETYTSWEEVESITKDWLKSKYANEYKLLFEKSDLEIKFWQNYDLSGSILESKEKFNGNIKIKLKNNDFVLEDKISFEFKINWKGLLEEYSKNIDNQNIGDITYKLDYHIKPHKFNEWLKYKTKTFFENHKLNGHIANYTILDQDNLKFKVGTNNISINLTYQGYTKKITLKSTNKKLNLSDYNLKVPFIRKNVDASLDATAFDAVPLNENIIIQEFVKTLKNQIHEFRSIDINDYIKLFTYKADSPVHSWFGDPRGYYLNFTSTILDNVEGTIKIRIFSKKNLVHIEKLADAFLKQQKKENPDLFNLTFDLRYDPEFYFDENGLKSFEKIKKKYETLIAWKINQILINENLWFAKTLKRKEIHNDYSFDFTKFTLHEDFQFGTDPLNMYIYYKEDYHEVSENAKKYYFSKSYYIENPLNIQIITGGLLEEKAKSFIKELDENQKTHFYNWVDEKNKQFITSIPVTGLMNDDIDDWIDVKEFIEKRLPSSDKEINFLKHNKMIRSRNLSSDKNGYFYYFNGKGVVLNVYVDNYNNDGTYKHDTLSHPFYTGKIKFKLWYVKDVKWNNSYLHNRIYKNVWHFVEKEYDLINKVEFEWYSKFRSTLENGGGYPNSWQFTRTRTFEQIGSWIYNEAILWNSPYKWESKKHPSNSEPYWDGDWLNFDFVIEKKKQTQGHNKLFYNLKLGGTRDWEAIKEQSSRSKHKFPNHTTIGWLFNSLGWGKIDLNFRLYRLENEISDKKPISIDKDKRYIISTYTL